MRTAFFLSQVFVLSSMFQSHACVTHRPWLITQRNTLGFWEDMSFVHLQKECLRKTSVGEVERGKKSEEKNDDREREILAICDVGCNPNHCPQSPGTCLTTSLCTGSLTNTAARGSYTHKRCNSHLCFMTAQTQKFSVYKKIIALPLQGCKMCI